MLTIKMTKYYRCVHGPTEYRRYPGYARHAHSQDTEPRAHAWFRHRPPCGTDFAWSVQGEPRFPSHRVGAADPSRMARCRVAANREFPPREVLYTHPCGQK